MTSAPTSGSAPPAPTTPVQAPSAAANQGGFRKLAIRIIVVAAVVLVCVLVWRKMHEPANLNLNTAKIVRGDLIETVTATGSITAQTGAEVHIGSQIVGRIKRLATDVGSYVKAGQLIAELDLPDLQDQLNQSRAAQMQAETKYAQQVSGTNMVVTQSASSADVARQAVTSAMQKLMAAEANAKLQQQQTPTDIEKASTALSTSKSVQVQTQAGAALQINTAQEAEVQAKANATNSAINLVSATTLYNQGFSAKTDLDTARAADGVCQSLVRSSVHNVALVRQKVTADLQAASDSVASAKSVLDAANSETQTVLARVADVADAAAVVQQARANLAAALANRVNNTLKQQDVLTAQQAVKQAKALVAYSQAQMDKSVIRSPISGTVLQLSSQQGETVAAGLTTQTLLIVADLKRLEVDAFVDETDIGKVAIGQHAQCTVSAFPGETFTGTVTKIASGSTIQLAVVTYDVTVAIQDPKHKLKPDMTSKVIIETGHLKNVILVKAFAVQLGTSGSTVNVLKMADGKQIVVATPVKTGGTDGINIEITSGLKEGDTVVLAGATATTTAKPASSPFGGSRGGGGGGR